MRWRPRARQGRPPDRRRHRHGRRHLARRRQGRQLGEADRRQVRHPHASPASPTDGLKTTIAGTVDFVPVEPFCSTELGERMADIAAEEAIAESGIGAQGRFSRPAVPRGAAGRDRMAAARASWRRRPAPTTRSTTTICCARAASGRFTRYPRALPVRLGRRASRRPVRHQGLADLAVDRLRLGRDRDPARRRGDPPRRNRRRAVHRHRRLGQSGSADPLLAAVGAVDRRTIRRRRRPSRSPRTATASSWPKAPARWCSKAYESAQGARREDPRRDRRLRRDGGRLPPHPLEPGRQADHRLHPQRARRRRPHARRHRLHQPARHRHARERQDGISRRRRPCSASAPKRSRCRRTSR